MTEDRMRLLLDKVAELRSLADSLEMAAALLEGTDRTVASSEDAMQPAIDEVRGEASINGMERGPSLTEVRAVLADKSRDGHTARIKKLLQKYGAPRLSEVDPVHYRDLLDEGRCLGATKADIEQALAEKEAVRSEFPPVFEHHGATCLDDLNEEYYPSFLRDIRRLSNG
jgi:hypothetical protein